MCCPDCPGLTTAKAQITGPSVLALKPSLTLQQLRQIVYSDVQSPQALVDHVHKIPNDMIHQPTVPEFRQVWCCLVVFDDVLGVAVQPQQHACHANHVKHTAHAFREALCCASAEVKHACPSAAAMCVL